MARTALARLFLKFFFCRLSGEQKGPQQRKPHYVPSSYGDEWRSTRRSRLAAGPAPSLIPAAKKEMSPRLRREPEGIIAGLIVLWPLIPATFLDESQGYSKTQKPLLLRLMTGFVFLKPGRENVTFNQDFLLPCKPPPSQFIKSC